MTTKTPKRPNYKRLFDGACKLLLQLCTEHRGTLAALDKERAEHADTRSLLGAADAMKTRRAPYLEDLPAARLREMLTGTVALAGPDCQSARIIRAALQQAELREQRAARPPAAEQGGRA